MYIWDQVADKIREEWDTIWAFFLTKWTDSIGQNVDFCALLILSPTFFKSNQIPLGMRMEVDYRFSHWINLN
jgi:hypothetical protein